MAVLNSLVMTDVIDVLPTTDTSTAVVLSSDVLTTAEIATVVLSVDVLSTAGAAVCLAINFNLNQLHPEAHDVQGQR